MAIYFGDGANKKVKIYCGGILSQVIFSTNKSPMVVDGGKMMSVDYHTLQDINGLYLIPNEVE